MAISDERLAAKIETIRREQQERMRRSGSGPPARVIGEEMLRLVAASMNEALLAETWARPEYRPAAAAMAHHSLPEQADNRILSHALSDTLRFAAGIWALGLHGEPAGLTISRLNAVLEAVGYGSRTWAHAVFAYLRFLGYIEPDHGGGDRRERRFRPTARMRAAFREHYVKHMRIASGLDPDLAAYADRLDGDDGAFDRFMGVLSEGQLTSAMIHRLNTEPTMDVFARRRSGMTMFWALVTAAPEGPEWPSAAWFPVSLSDLARRAGVSRMHFARLLRDVGNIGMVETDGAGNLRIRDSLRLEVNTFAAMVLLSFTFVRQVAEAREAEARAA